MPEVYVAAGSNRGPVSALRFAQRELAARFGVVRLSPVYRSPDHTGRGADYLNSVMAFSAGLTAPRLRDVLRGIERAGGRGREAPGECALDLDVLLVRDGGGDGPLPVPHPDLLRRGELIAAVASLEPSLACAGVDGTMEQLRAERGDDPAFSCLGDLAGLPDD